MVGEPDAFKTVGSQFAFGFGKVEIGGIIDQSIDLIEFAVDPVGEFMNASPGRKVEFSYGGFSTCFAAGLFGLFAISAGEDHMVAGGGDLFGSGFADAGIRSGDDNGFFGHWGKVEESDGGGNIPDSGTLFSKNGKRA